MNKPLLAAPIALAAALTASAGFAKTAPCEDMLAQVRAAVPNANLNATDKAKVDDLTNKGIERCNADDDKRADDFFAQALKLMGK